MFIGLQLNKISGAPLGAQRAAKTIEQPESQESQGLTPFFWLLAITRQHPLQDAAHIVLSSFDQMHMNGHQAISIKEKWEPPLLPCQKRKELFVVGRRVEYLPAIIATRDHVLQTAFNFHPRAGAWEAHASLGSPRLNAPFIRF